MILVIFPEVKCKNTTNDLVIKLIHSVYYAVLTCFNLFAIDIPLNNHSWITNRY